MRRDQIFKLGDTGVHILKMGTFIPPMGIISAPESALAQTYRDPLQQTRFILRRMFLRMHIGEYTGARISEFKIETDPLGKLFTPAVDIQFNSSSSGDYALFALSKSHMVGVDIQAIDQSFDYEPLLGDYFTPEEADRIDSVEAFTWAWVRKEACAKAIGVGLSQGLKGYDISDENPMLHDLEVPEGYVAALAILPKLI